MPISVDLCGMSQLACSFLIPTQILANDSARVFMYADLCRMSQLACSFLMPMQIPSNVLARVLISVDLCGMSQLACSFPHFCGSHELPPRLQPTKKHVSNCYLLVSHMVWSGRLLIDFLLLPLKM